MLELIDVQKSFGDLRVLTDVNLTCDQGETLCLIGPSGSGKSTALRCINWLEKPDDGLVVLDGEPMGYRRRGSSLVTLSARQLQHQRLKVGMVFQKFNVFPHMTSLENVAFPLYNTTRTNRRDAYDEANRQLTRVGLGDKQGSYARQLSGGQQQRVAIARALALKPKVLLFDEPTSALDPELVGEVLSVMKNLADGGMTMIVVTHEMAFAANVASRVVFLEDGVVVEDGSPDEVLRSPRNARTAAFVGKFHGVLDGASARHRDASGVALDGDSFAMQFPTEERGSVL